MNYENIFCMITVLEVTFLEKDTFSFLLLRYNKHTFPLLLIEILNKKRSNSKTFLFRLLRTEDGAVSQHTQQTVSNLLSGEADTQVSPAGYAFVGQVDGFESC